MKFPIFLWIIQMPDFRFFLPNPTPCFHQLWKVWNFFAFDWNGRESIFISVLESMKMFSWAVSVNPALLGTVYAKRWQRLHHNLIWPPLMVVENICESSCGSTAGATFDVFNCRPCVITHEIFVFLQNTYLTLSDAK